jgi:ketosteroid isomerase-like protein
VDGVGVTEHPNIELARRGIEAFNARDLDTMLEIGGDDFEYDWSRSIGPNQGVFRGPAGFLEFMNDQWSTFEEVTVEPTEMIPCGSHVIVMTRTYGRGRDGVEVSANSAQLYTFEDGRLVRITLFQERDEALAAATAEAE